MGMVMKDVGDMPWDERSFAGGRVNTLRMIPINEAELVFLRENSIEELIKQCPAPKLMHIFSGTPKFLPYSASPDFVRMS